MPTHRLGSVLVLAWLALASAPAHAQDPVIGAAGDIACDPEGASFNGGLGTADRCRQLYTSDLLVGDGLAAVLPLGDVQYEYGTLEQFEGSYDLSWGRLKNITRPAIGNHEYSTAAGPSTADGSGYFDYFNGVGNETGPAGDRDEGWYSYDIGKWHMIALNSMCGEVGGCDAGSPQERWLRADLAANADAACTLAYWHHPLFSSGPNGNFKGTAWDTTDLWQALYDAGAELVLTAHTHAYERFDPQDAQGNADPAHGIRQLIVGTGGRNHGQNGTPQPNSVLRNNTDYGAMKIVLRPNGYDWTLLGEDGGQGDGETLDSGSAGCHGPPDVIPPQTSIASGPEGLTARRDASFAFTSSEVGSSFRCTLDGPGTVAGSETGCSSPASYGGLADGNYTFSVRAFDAEANPDPEPATRSFTVDTAAPDTSITSGPETSTRATDATVSFSSPEPGVTFECRLDSGAWTGCTSPASYAALAGGPHTFEVRALDAAGNADPTPATHSWSIDLEQEFRPSSYRVLAGSVFRDKGSIRRLYRNDRWRLRIAAAEKRRSRFVAHLEVKTAAGVDQSAALQGLRLAYDGGATARRAAVVVRVFNRRTRGWVKALGPRRGRRDRHLEWSASAFAADYLSRRGAVRVRVKGKATRPFRMRSDLVGLTVQY